MDARIGTLAVRYYADGMDALVAARLPALTRALERDLADALDSRLTAALGDGREVYVIRELHAATAVSPESLTLDGPVVDHISRVYADAIGQVLARPNDDVVRFEDTAGFVAAFIMDELTGGGSDHWYFGAFEKFRDADSRRTVEAVLAAYPDHVGVVIGRLARRGYLEEFLALIGASRALELADVGTEGTSRSGDGVVLVETALDIATRLGWPIDGALRATLRQALLLNLGPMRPDWTDRRRLTEFVWDCVEEAAAMLQARGVCRGPCNRTALEESLRGPLDWLDHTWIADRVDSASGPFSAAVTAPVVSDPLRVVIDRVVRALTEGRVAARADHGVDQIVARLIAAASLEVGEASLVAPLRRLLTEAAIDWRSRTLASDAPADSAGAIRTNVGSTTINPERSPRRGARPVARELAAALDALSEDLDERGVPTSGAGLYLMSRAILDVGLPGLAKVHDVPWPALLAGIATAWLGLEGPFDRPTLAWTGATDTDETSPERLSGCLTNVHALEEALRQRLRAQQVALSAIDAALGGPSDDDTAGVTACLQRIADLLLAAWARWLRGLEASSPRFLVDRCFRRRSAVRITESTVTVALEPAPLDVVLRMAGYFQPIEKVPWLDGRSVAFNVLRFVA